MMVTQTVQAAIDLVVASAIPQGQTVFVSIFPSAKSRQSPKPVAAVDVRTLDIQTKDGRPK